MGWFDDIFLLRSNGDRPSACHPPFQLTLIGVVALRQSLLRLYFEHCCDVGAICGVAEDRERTVQRFANLNLVPGLISIRGFANSEHTPTPDPA